ncbi:DesA family fatty acid desaturase [Hydromonas duriensis]|uniref:Stearoyl-CoA desaturase (Delta-9 desaturase) n=1 Tax=Hydromonas duriensis TaxID=1527608 RepID=A0A4R6YA58_9BURK|nr:fatty acid desaturase [Hydromonas duriensis]TDR32357.1 stearoyl-CoA desaturase (delta-9 desaturase) [Hydromonas duriensis]
MNELLNFLSNGVLGWSIGKMVIFTLVVTHITIASVTIYLHRHSAHRALDLHPIPAHFFRFWLWLTTGQHTKAWTAIHRKHHAKCETEEDPHSPVTKGLSTVLWQGADLYRMEAKNQETLQKYGAGTPDDWMERHVYTPRTYWGIVFMFMIDFVLFGFAGITIWAIQMAWIPFFAAGIINGIGHFYGYRNFDSPDTSTNISPWGLLIGGEELHNNHHTFATSAKFSNKWYEFDLGWYYIKAMSLIGWAKVKKIQPKAVFVKNIPVDEHTLESIIKNRYDVMAKYAQSLRQSVKTEIEALRATNASAAKRLSEIRKPLLRDSEHIAGDVAAKVQANITVSPTLEQLYVMRNELSMLWRRSSLSKDELLAHLHDWCDRAEQSGIEALRRFALQLRTYR